MLCIHASTEQLKNLAFGLPAFILKIIFFRSDSIFLTYKLQIINERNKDDNIYEWRSCLKKERDNKGNKKLQMDKRTKKVIEQIFIDYKGESQQKKDIMNQKS